MEIEPFVVPVRFPVGREYRRKWSLLLRTKSFLSYFPA
jgi:hypothetical protein